MRLTSAIIATLTILGAPPRPGGAVAQQLPANASLPNYRYTVVHTYPHDPLAFTQGLQYVDGFLYEGTGQNGQSSIRKVKLENGEVVQRRDIAAEYFGEGITVWKSELVQLTWKSGVAFVYDRQTFAPRGTFSYSGEGWGLTEDGVGLIMSDGTDSLRFLDPGTFAARRRLHVPAPGKAVRNLNELEFVKGEVFANVWMTDDVARIDPASGKVTGWIDLRGLLTGRERASADVHNGIAYDSAGDRLFVTGKWWPKLFEIRLQRKS